jgi:hypothetical protein
VSESTVCARRHGTLEQIPQQRGEYLARVRVGHQGHQQRRSDRGSHAHLAARHSLDLPGRADAGVDLIDRVRPAATVQFLLRGPEPGVITLAARGLDPPIAAQPGQRDRHDLAPGHRLTGGDPLDPATTSAERPSPPESARTGQANAETGTATISVVSSRPMDPAPLPPSPGVLAAEGTAE